MAYWFHRNLSYKITALYPFELHGVTTSEPTRKIFSDIRQARDALLQLLTDPNHSRDVIDKATKDYFSLLLGLISPIDPQEQENKLQKIFKFGWAGTLIRNVVQTQYNAAFEYAHMTIEVALWYTKHSAKFTANEETNIEEAEEAHKCLRLAAGIFTYVKNELIGKLSENTKKNGVDTDSRVLDAYINQCIAEAQEVTLARAEEMKHSASEIAALSYQTSQLYQAADDALSSLSDLEVELVGKWKKYFQLKQTFYLSYAHYFHGETLLAQDKCGEAIRGLRESVELYEKSSLLCKEYATLKFLTAGAGPQDHIIFRKFGSLVRRTLEKCERENDMIYHQKVPSDTPQLELKATYGLVSPEDYSAPALHSLWTLDLYKQVNLTMPPNPQP